MRRTPWLWATLTFALVAVFFFVGPFEVLTPFVISEQVGGGSAEYGILLAAFGISSAIGALAISSRPLPRRYLSVMIFFWGFGLLPLALFGIATELWILVLAAIVIGMTEGIGMVIWGTLLQRRVPDALRGRVSSLDFFVSLALMPASMALAGPAAEAFGLTAVFVVRRARLGRSAAPVILRLGRLARGRAGAPPELMEPLEVILVAVGVIAGATLQSAMGFGFALVAGPAVFAVAEPAEAITILITLGTALNLLIMLAERRPSEVLRPEVVRILAWAAPGVVAGMFILLALSKPTLQVIVGISVDRRRRRSRPGTGWRRKEGNPVARAAAGLAAGTLTTTTATAGPPLVLYLQSTGVRPEPFRDTMAALLLGLNIMGADRARRRGQPGGVARAWRSLRSSSWMVVVGRLGGRILFDRFDHHSFRVAGLGLIVVSGVASIVAGLAGG